MVKIKKIFSILLVVLLVGVSFIGCSSGNLVKKHAKKLNNYTIDVDVDTSLYTASCYEKLEYKNRTDSAIDTLVFHLYPRAFREEATIKPYSSLAEARCFPNGVDYGDMFVNEVKVNGNKHEFNLVGEDFDKMEIILDNKLYMDDKVCVEIYFDLDIPNCTHRFGYYNGNINLANFYPILSVIDSGEYDMTPYYSNGDPFYSDCANYIVNVTSDNNYSVYTSGSLIKESGNQSKTKRSYIGQAMRDFAIVMGNNMQAKTIETKNYTINYVGYLGDEDIDRNLKLAYDAVSYFSKIFISYPYKVLNIIKTPFLHGGMEYPGLVMISDTINETEEMKKVIVHEVSHEWWYGIVGTNESSYAWIDEGLAEYSSALFFDANKNYNINYNDMINDAITSYTLYVDVVSSINKTLNTRMDLKINEYVNEYEYTYMIYIKGLLLFDDLSTLVGKSNLIKALKKIANKYAFKNIDTDIFTESIKKFTQKDTENFFNSYLEGNVLIGKLH